MKPIKLNDFYKDCGSKAIARGKLKHSQKKWWGRNDKFKPALEGRIFLPLRRIQQSFNDPCKSDLCNILRGT